MPVAGYVWSGDPAAAGYAYNSTGRGVRVDRRGTGAYTVTFAGMGADGGIAHVTANGWDNSAYCAIADWKLVGSDEVVRVRCFGPGGAPADSLFVANFTARDATAAPFMSYLLSTGPTPAAAYVPPAATRFDTFGAPPTVERLAPGRYRVTDDPYETAIPLTSDAFVATAYGWSAHCWGGRRGRGYVVLCTDASGAPVDSRFSYTYVRGGDVVGRVPPAWGTAWGRFLTPITGAVPAEMSVTSSGAPATYEWLGVGLYRLVFPGLGAWGGHAQVAPRAAPRRTARWRTGGRPPVTSWSSRSATTR